MSALQQAIKTIGGPGRAASICGVSPRAVHKWLSKGRLPRTEYTGETRYAELIAAHSDGAFTAEELLAACRSAA